MYRYAANNPVRYTDPDGREAGYVTDNTAAKKFGHSGMYVQNTEGKYIFFEIIGEGERETGNGFEPLEDATDNSLPFPALAKKFGLPCRAYCLMKVFNDKDEMKEELSQLGFDDSIDFNTTPEQDAIILKAAMEQGKNYSSYNVLTNNCGQWARNVLCTKGSGIRAFHPFSIFLKLIAQDAFGMYLECTIPKNIRRNLILGNRHATYNDWREQ